MDSSNLKSIYEVALLLNAENVCRFCLQDRDSMANLREVLRLNNDMGQPQRQGDIPFIYETVTSFKLEMSTDYPPNICKQCEIDLRRAFETRRKLIEIDVFLKDFIAKHRIAADAKIPENCEIKIEKEEISDDTTEPAVIVDSDDDMRVTENEQTGTKKLEQIANGKDTIENTLTTADSSCSNKSLGSVSNMKRDSNLFVEDVSSISKKRRFTVDPETSGFYDETESNSDCVGLAINQLNTWGLSELANSFRENDIDIFCMHQLNENDLKHLCRNKKLNLRIRLRENLRKIRNNTVQRDERYEADDDLISDSRNSDSKHKTSETIPCSIKQILDGCSKGNIVYTVFEKEGRLNGRSRKIVVDAIVEYYISINVSLTKTLFMELAEEIVQLFPKENKDTYYMLPYKIGSTYFGASGKLITKYNNATAELRKLDKAYKKFDTTQIETVYESEVSQNESLEIDTEEMQEAKNWLNKINIDMERYQNIENKWKLTASIRQADYSKCDIHYLLKNWPLLITSIGYRLINIDFEKEFPNASSIMLKWSTFSEKLRPLLFNIKDVNSKILSKQLDMRTTSEDGRNITILAILPALILPSNKIRSKTNESCTKRYCWRPSINESRDGILLHVQVEADINQAMTEKKSNSAMYDINLSPMIVIIGQTLETCKTFYVWYEDIHYKLPTFLECVDTCFKLTRVLKLGYNIESVQIWQFIQQYFYNIILGLDKKLSAVETFITDVS